MSCWFIRVEAATCPEGGGWITGCRK